MKYNKNSLANLFQVMVVIAALFLIGLLIFGNAGVDGTDKKPVFAGEGAGTLSYENHEMVDIERQTL